MPEPGRYGTDDAVSADAEPPRRITRLAYRLDGEGFVADKPQQLFVLDARPARPLPDPTSTGPAEPVQLTDEPSGVADPAFTGDGRLVYVRSTGIDELTDEIAVIDIPEAVGRRQRGAAPTRGALLVPTRGSAASLTVDGGQIYYLGVDFTGIDAVGRTTGLWSAALTGGPPRRLTEEDSVDVDRAAGRPVGRSSPPVRPRAACSSRCWTGARRRCGRCRPVPAKAHWSTLPALIAGPRVVRSFSCAGRNSSRPWWRTARRPARWSRCRRRRPAAGRRRTAVDRFLPRSRRGRDPAGHRAVRRRTGRLPGARLVGRTGRRRAAPGAAARARRSARRVHAGAVRRGAGLRRRRVRGRHGKSARFGRLRPAPRPRGRRRHRQRRRRRRAGAARPRAAAAGVRRHPGRRAGWVLRRVHDVLAVLACARPVHRGDQRASAQRLGFVRRVQRHRLLLRPRLRRRRPRQSMARITSRLRRRDRRAAADHSFRTRLALPGRAGAADVRGAEVPRRRGGDAAVPGRGARAVPVGPAAAPPGSGSTRSWPGGIAICRSRRPDRRAAEFAGSRSSSPRRRADPSRRERR